MYNYDRIEIYAKSNEKLAIKRLAKKKHISVSRLLLDSVLGEVNKSDKK